MGNPFTPLHVRRDQIQRVVLVEVKTDFTNLIPSQP